MSSCLAKINRLLVLLPLFCSSCVMFGNNPPPKFLCFVCKDAGIYTSNVGAKEFCYNCKKGETKKVTQFSSTPINELLNLLEFNYLTYYKFRYDEFYAIEYYDTIIIIKDEIRKRIQ